ncbi:maleylpyruvate isomerase family mycothiol-dependent enzyme [Mycolicibacterium baixiangningiae]|uniref:maleylpyruvate isomerase family mycothiol-dependent enzyme n=1 Tax=Mycolicibacterium baixiangningiae TaxID=2761578 RepID=UPI001E60870A|nr:maleylpyruvate isomerase family mycothiol-dependent enzyme [Mycolicibacterium baixiangningiae]
MSTSEAQRSAELYQESRERIVGLLTALDEAGWDAAAPACPGWRVRDVVSHLVAVAEEWVDGRLAGVPTDEQTAAQVARFRGAGTTDVLAAWAAAAGELERQAQTRGLVAPVADIVSHEHDIRGALGRPGARDSAGVRHSSEQVLDILQPPVPLRVIVEDSEYRSGPASGDELRLRTSRFESLRWRTGRRSRAQLAAMDWSAEPGPVLDALYLFGPATDDVVE